MRQQRATKRGAAGANSQVSINAGKAGEARRGQASQGKAGKAGKQGANKTMSRETDNALLMHGGEDDISIPGAALRQIIDDALTPDCGDMISRLRMQNEALEEHNANQAREIGDLKFEIRELRERLAGRVYE